jgi:hypothetical protein
LPFGRVGPTGTGTIACAGSLGLAKGFGGADEDGGVLCCAWIRAMQNATSKIDK